MLIRSRTLSGAIIDYEIYVYPRQVNKSLLIPFLNRIMMLLSKEKLKRLEALWEDYPDGLNTSVFANIIMDSIDCSQADEKYELLHGALKLFSEIDINGDQSMEWSEFMAYMIDAANNNSGSQ
jgi:hypothetical protein